MALSVGAGCYRSLSPESDSLSEPDTRHEEIEQGTESTDVESGQPDTGEDTGLPKEDDYILQVEEEELVEFQETGRIYFYWFNTQENYFAEDDMSIGPLRPSEDAHAAQAVSDVFLCSWADPGAQSWGSGLVVLLQQDEFDNALPVDVSQYRGVALWAVHNAGDFALFVCLPDVNTYPDGGRCGVGYNCHEDWCKEITLTKEWTLHTVLFEELTQSGPSRLLDRFERTEVYGLKLQSKIGVTLDYCVDEILFIR
jgi:hypothetical protein